MSFRSTTSAREFTKRGFRVIVDRDKAKVRFVFDSSKVNTSQQEIKSWLAMVGQRIGLGQFEPEPYWGFEDLKYAVGEKIKNCFYVIADSKLVSGREYFLYKELHLLYGFSFENFLKCVEDSTILVDFDARTGHNHGTKFRMKQGCWSSLYSRVERVM